MARLDRLKAVIDAYGGNPERWPETERTELAALASGRPELASMLAEARALDAVLRSAPAGDASRLLALGERILTDAGASGGGNVASGGRVMPLQKRPARPAPYRSPLWAAAALAASLFVGVVLGASDFGRPALEELAGLAGFETGGGALDALADTDVELL